MALFWVLEFLRGLDLFLGEGLWNCVKVEGCGNRLEEDLEYLKLLLGNKVIINYEIFILR
jgi:hypothetical protein